MVELARYVPGTSYSANKTSITDSPKRHSALPLHSSVVDLKKPKCDLYDI